MREIKPTTPPRFTIPRHPKLEPEKLLVSLNFLDLFMSSVIYFWETSLQNTTSAYTGSQTMDGGSS